jgi:hypothetical protein
MPDLVPNFSSWPRCKTLLTFGQPNAAVHRRIANPDSSLRIRGMKNRESPICEYRDLIPVDLQTVRRFP